MQNRWRSLSQLKEKNNIENNVFLCTKFKCSNLLE